VAAELTVCTVADVVVPQTDMTTGKDVRTYEAVAERIGEVISLVRSPDGIHRVARVGKVTMIALPDRPPKLLRRLAFGVRATRSVRRIHRTKPIDVISASDPLLSGVVGLVCRRITGRPLLVHVQGELLDLPESDIGWIRRQALMRLSRFIVRRADYVRCVSRSIVRAAQRVGVPAERIFELPMRVDTRLFSRPAHLEEGRRFRARLGWEREFIVGFVGSLTTHKGVRHLLEAVARARSRAPNVRLLVAGSGALQDELEARASRPDLDGACRFLGRLPHERIPELLAAIDAFVLSSLNEGIPRVVLESMAMEAPVVATRVGGLPELITDRETGLLVPPADADALARAIQDLAASPDLRTSLAQRARTEVAERYEYEQNIEQYVQMLFRCAERSKAKDARPSSTERPR